MNHREKIIAVVKGGDPGIIPSYRECSMDVSSLKGLLPKSSGDHIEDSIRLAEFFDNSVCSVSIGIMNETISRNENHHIYRCETGVVWEEHYKPTFFKHARDFPVNSPSEALDFKMPEVKNKKRYDKEKIKADVQTFHDRGYFVDGYVPGAWQMIYYYMTSFDNILAWMAIEPDAAESLFREAARFSLDAAFELLDCGVDCIFTGSDFGSGRSLLFSPAMFRKYAREWIDDIARMCHKKGAFLQMHSHGHIQELMDDMVEAGIDILNPVGPSDYNDLAMFKKRWGSDITFSGGISTTVGSMAENEIAAHVREVMDIGRVGGRFFPRSESGLPNMSGGKLRVFLETVKRERLKGYLFT